MRTKFVIALFIGIVILSSCSSNGNKMFDEKYKTIYINGVSAIEGKNAVIASLINSGFEMDEYVDTLEQVYPKHARFICYFPDKKQFDHVFWNILDGLEYDTSEIDVTLSWYKDGTIRACYLCAGPWMSELPQESVTEINKRLTERFEHSKIGNSAFGYKIYYNDNGVSLYYTNRNEFEVRLHEE